MGYKNFALLSVEEPSGYEFDDEFCEYIENIGAKYKYDGDPIFGFVHRTSSTFSDSFHDECDRVINKISKKYKTLTFHVYVSEFDGENLSKITYKYGQDKKIKILNVTVNEDKSCSVYTTIDSLSIKNNLSEFFCKDYGFSFEP